VLVALYGPTSSGKTALSVELARRIERDLGRPVVIISADSRQVYRYMDIGTSKTTPAEMGGIRHEMIDVVEPVRKLELEQYARLARPHLGTEGVALVVGGTGVYVKALLEGWTLDAVGAARDALRRDFPRAMAADAYAMLRRLDRTARVHPNNYEAIINALATRMGGGPAPAAAAPAVILGLDPGAAAVDRRVAATYDDQVRRGLFDEIQALAARYDLERRPGTNEVLHTHGYREWFDVARARGKPLAALNAQDRAEVREQVVAHIRGYTRRQRSWFAKLPGVRLVRSADQAFSQLARRS
jgi:tRNA dimethylallyltransferase